MPFVASSRPSVECFSWSGFLVSLLRSVGPLATGLLGLYHIDRFNVYADEPGEG